MEILQYEFFRNAIFGSVLASIICGYIGTYIVTRRLVLISGGITHASFGGIGLGVFMGISPIVGAMMFAIASACGVQYLSHRADVREDSAIALVWTLGMSVGIIFCFLTPSFMPDMASYLFGNILTIGRSDIWLMTALAVVVVAIFSLCSHTIVSIAFDPVFARTKHLPVEMIEYLMMILIAMAIVSTLRMVGVVLAISLLTIPQMTANLFTSNFRHIVWWSIFFGCISCLAGLAASYQLNVPSGASIIFISIAIYVIAKIAKTACHKKYTL